MLDCAELLCTTGFSFAQFNICLSLGCAVVHNLDLVQYTILGCALCNVVQIVGWLVVLVVHNLTLGEAPAGGARLRHCPPTLGPYSTLLPSPGPYSTLLPFLGPYSAQTPDLPWVPTLPGHSFYN